FVIEDRAYIATGLRPDGSSRRDVYEFIPPSLGITSIALIDASQDQRLLTLSDGMVINLDDLNSNEFSLQAFPNLRKVGSVSLELQGPKQQSTLENFFPYTLFGDQDGKDIQGVDLLPGNYTIRATAYSQRDGQGEASNSLSISFTVIGTPQPKVQGFLLINADTDEVIQEIKADDVISVDALGTDHFSIQALTSPQEVGSVKMLLTGPNRAFGPIQDERLENQPPYTLYGDDNGKDIQGRDFFVGERAYTIRASAFTGGNATGDQGPERTVSFRIVSSLSIGALTLVNADSDQDIVTLSEGTVFNSSKVAQNLSIRSDVLGAGSVRLILRDAQGQVLENPIENVKPYSLFGENDPGDFIGNAFASGSYQIEVLSYARSRGLGNPGASKIINFEVINSPALAFGIWGQTEEIQLVAYPNPTQQNVQLDIPKGLSDEIVVEIFNENGQSVLKKASSNQQGIMELDLSQQAEGMYFIVLKDASGRTIQKRVLKK
ncbi:MAG: T9SS type A sorting domain-containing protein, partial [Bacteroidota bacterium]